MSKEKQMAADLLCGALRQYRHNDRDGFVPAWDYQETIEIVGILLTRCDELSREKAVITDLLEESRRNDMHCMSWLADARLASGDDGKRMLPGFVQYLKDLKAQRDELLEALDLLIDDLALRARLKGEKCLDVSDGRLFKAQKAIARAKGEKNV